MGYSKPNNIRLRNEDGDLIVTLPSSGSSFALEGGKFIGSAAGLTNFPSSLLTVSAGNTNYLRRTTVPASNTAFGSYNQFALDNTNLYIYNATSSKWLRISGTLEW